MSKSKDTYTLSWNEDSFRAKLRLFFLSRREAGHSIGSPNRHLRAEGYSALSSTYYSIAGTGLAKLRAAQQQHKLRGIVILPVWCLTWLPLSAWCYLRMLPLSNEAINILGHDNATANQLDIRQSILRKRGNYDEAIFCAQAALQKIPDKAHTRGLLHIGLAEAYQHLGDEKESRVHLDIAIAEAKLAEDEDPRQAARIYRQAAGLTGDYILAENWRYRARLLAEEVGAKDQLAKIG